MDLHPATPAAVSSDDPVPCRTTLRPLVLAGVAATGLPVAILLAVCAVVDWPGLPAALAAGAGAWLAASVVLALVMRHLTGPLERVVAEAAERATAARASLEQQVVTRTLELSEARDRAEHESRLKGVFLAAMSHEIRTPMTSIVGMAELMAETALDAEQREYCDTIRTSTDALLGVINDILDFSKMEAQGVSLETVDFDLRVVIDDAVELLAVKAAAAGLDLSVNVEPGFDGRFRGDPSRLRQVVTNLLANAVKFTSLGHVLVRVAAVQRGATDTRVRVEVADSGIGMTPEGLTRLFRPFAQAETSTTRQYGGTGLGLTICKQIVERMGGAIGVTSEPGRGSTFWFDITLPHTTAIAVAPGLAWPVADALVLEPAPASGDALAQLLAELGVAPTWVATAGDALAALDARPTGFAVAFVSVDAVDVAPFVDVLAQHPRAAQTVVVAVVPAGRRVGADLERLGSTHHLTRPVRRTRLVECLDVIAANRHPAAAVAAATAPPAAAAGPTVASAQMADGPPRVLIADDYYANQRLVTRLLEKRGYLVEAVSDGQTAVDAALDRPFDVVLMDCNMPIIDGYEATARIRAGEVGRRTPIVAMTAHDSSADRDICLRAGMDDYLVKPIQAHLVIAAIERWSAIARRQAPAAAVDGGSR